MDLTFNFWSCLMQIASFLAGLFYSRLIKCAVIVAPKTLIAHWAKELASVGLARKTHEYVHKLAIISKLGLYC